MTVVPMWISRSAAYRKEFEHALLLPIETSLQLRFSTSRLDVDDTGAVVPGSPAPGGMSSLPGSPTKQDGAGSPGLPTRNH